MNGADIAKRVCGTKRLRLPRETVVAGQGESSRSVMTSYPPHSRRHVPLPAHRQPRIQLDGVNEGDCRTTLTGDDDGGVLFYNDKTSATPFLRC
jgi:hypothetical protein